MVNKKRLDAFILFNSIIFIILFFLSTYIILLTNPRIENINVELNFNGNNSFLYVQDQLNINTTHFRIPGTKGREDCAQYFITKFQNINSSFLYTLQNFTVQSVNCQNILFKLNENKKNIVILGAHYDSRAKATKDPDLMKRDDPVPGANDGASGCAVLIELANILYQKRDKLDCQIWFLFFDAEDQGQDSGGYGIDGWDWCEGSKMFTQDIHEFYDSSKEQINCMILLDLVGGINLQFIAEQYSTSSLLNELFDVGRNLGYITEFPSLRTSSNVLDDHYYFEELGIPSADLIINFWNNPNWPYHHTVRDDNSTISRHSLEVTGKTVEQFIYNNYLSGENVYYQGHFPWTHDLNSLDSEIMILLTITCLVIIILFFVQYTYHQIEFRKTFELLK